MPVLFIYLLKVSVSLGLVYLFYYFFLRNLTFYSWNRWYLLGYSVLSFFIPLINISALVEQNQATPIKIIKYVPVLDSYTTESLPSPEVVPINIENAAPDTWEWVLLILLIGTTILIIKVIGQLMAYLRFRRLAELVLDDGVKIYQVSQPITPFSFGRSIFINQSLHTPEELKEIIRHEFVHVKQGHTLDIIWGEIMCILNWYKAFSCPLFF